MTNMSSQLERRISAEDRHFLTDARHLPPCRRRFTLIEVLVVIGIAGLLLTLIGPAFNRMTRGNDVENHASGLKQGMERASSLAAASRRYVALLLPNKIDSSNKSKEAYPYQRGGYRLGYVTQGNSGTYTLDGWIPDSEWRNRSRGAYLYSVSKVSSIKKPTAKVKEDDYESEVAGASSLLHEIQDDGCSYLAVIFSPYGDVRTPASETELIFLVAGVNTTESDYMALRLNTFSGKVEFVEL